MTERRESVEITPYYYFQQQQPPQSAPATGVGGGGGRNIHQGFHHPMAQQQQQHSASSSIRQRQPPPPPHHHQQGAGGGGSSLLMNPPPSAGTVFTFGEHQQQTGGQHQWGTSGGGASTEQQQQQKGGGGEYSITTGNNNNNSGGNNGGERRKEVNRFETPFELYAMGWSVRQDAHLKFRIAVGSFIEEYCNKISIVQLHEERSNFSQLATFDHPYIPTKILWIPDPKGQHPDLLATTGDYLRLWRVGGHHGASLEVLLNNNRSAEYCAPLTSADWNEVDVSLLGTASIDTTCTIWQLETGQALATTERARGTVKTQLIAHDKEVFDLEFSKLGSGRDIFASAGADGSIRMFDLRHMEYSTIVFEEPTRVPLQRLAWNKQDPNYLATFAYNSDEVLLLDIRVPSMPVATLRNHTAPLNGIAWAPHSTCHICTVADDGQALIWDCHQIPRPVEDPILAYSAGGRINQVRWSSAQTDWIGICFDNTLELLRV